MPGNKVDKLGETTLLCTTPRRKTIRRRRLTMHGVDEARWMIGWVLEWPWGRQQVRDETKKKRTLNRTGHVEEVDKQGRKEKDKTRYNKVEGGRRVHQKLLNTEVADPLNKRKGKGRVRAAMLEGEETTETRHTPKSARRT